MKKKKSAFTLIEMLVVLVIITALVLLFVPNLLKQSDKAKAKSDEAFQQVINNQVILYETDHPNKKVTKWSDLEGYLSNKQLKEAQENDNIRAPWE